MARKILGSVSFKITAVVLIILIAALIIIVAHNSSSWIIILLCLIIAAGLVTLCAIYTERRLIDAINILSKEVENLSYDLSEKQFDEVTNDTRVFYDALIRTRRALDKKGRNRQELLEIVNSVASHMEITNLLHELLPKLNEATRSVCSAFYSVNNSTNKLEIKHSVGFSKNVYSEFDINLGEGLVGQAAIRRDITFYHNIPDDTVYYVRTFLGKLKPRSLMVVPVLSQDVIAGVLVCASIYEYSQDERDMIELIRHYVGVAVSNSSNFERTKRLTNELTFQNKLIQEQHEQMKTLLDEKAEWLNSMLRFMGSEAACAVDSKGAVVLWGWAAENIYGITARNAVGKSLEKICAETGWPSPAEAFDEALKNGSKKERFVNKTSEIEMDIRCVYGEQNNVTGAIIFINPYKAS